MFPNSDEQSPSPLGSAPVTTLQSGVALPSLCTSLPGPKSRAQVDVLAAHECPAITARRARRAASLGLAGDDPVVWAEALGANVLDVDGNRFVDLTSGFGVALVGHRHPSVVSAAKSQADRLLHAMGDAWPDRARIQLLADLAAFAPAGLDKALLGLSGSDAIDAMVKTALLATGRTGVLAFEGSYHGLALGTVGLQGYKADFVDPFRKIVHPDVRHLPFGCPTSALEAALSTGEVGLVLVEPIQGRGGLRMPPEGWLAELRALAHKHGALLGFDEVYTAFGRIGARSAAHHYGVTPDLMAVGKALGGGFPLSACLGTAQAMAAWGASRGEAIHTQTFLGHPIGCAAGSAVLAQVMQHDLPGRAATTGQALRQAIEAQGFVVGGLGLMLSVPLGARSYAVCRALLRRGYLVLPAGMQGEVLCLTPPVCLSTEQAEAFAAALVEANGECP